MAKKKVTTPMSGEDRKKQLLDVGANLAAKYGAANVTRRMVAKAAKVSEGLVANYCGNTGDAQKAYKRRMKALGLVEPAKDKIESIGVKLRAHGPRDARDTRKRSAKEVEAIKRKAAPATPAVKKAVKDTHKIAAKKAGAAKKSVSSSTRATKPAATAKKAPRNKALNGAPKNKALPHKYQPQVPPPGATEVALPPLPPPNTARI